MKRKKRIKKCNIFLSSVAVVSLFCLLSLVIRYTYQNKQCTTLSSYDYSDRKDNYSSLSSNSNNSELHGMWISFLNYKTDGYTKSQFTSFIKKTFDSCVSNDYNAVFVHVRMFSDAMYKSDYYPWSKYSSGKQGKSPGFDPLAIMIEEAHARNLKIHAWINPYRITSSTTSYSSIAKSSYAYKWSHSSSASKKRNVLSYGGALYFNPAKDDVRDLITNGVKEIVQNYDIDGIHFDDYFYPNLGSKYKKVFDSKEYNQYKNSTIKNGKKPMGIVSWRRNNVNTLIKNVYSTVKSIDQNCLFGISPAGSIINLYLNNSYYCDVKKWMNSSEYIDYICPQIYWSFKHPSSPYDKIYDEWSTLPRNENVNLYIGLAGYKAGISKSESKKMGDNEWSKSNTVLKRQVAYARKMEKSDGFVVFDYADLHRKSAKKEFTNLTKELKKK